MEAEKPGSQPIGSLIAKTMDTLRIADGANSGSPSRPRHSGTTMQPAIPPSPTGTQRGERGSGALTNSPSGTAALASMAQGLDRRNPARSLPQCVRSCLETRWVDGDIGHSWDGYVGGYELVAPVDRRELDDATAVIEEALKPAPEQIIIAELGRLRMLTVSRDIGQDLPLLFAAYTDELQRYPADAIRNVLREWPRTERFWPSVAELTERLKRIVRPREALREALRRGYHPPETSPDWIAPSEADKEAVTALLAKHGYSLDREGRVRPPEIEPLTPEIRRRLDAETKTFRLPPEDDPRVQARLREMGGDTSGGCS